MSFKSKAILGVTLIASLISALAHADEARYTGELVVPDFKVSIDAPETVWAGVESYEFFAKTNNGLCEITGDANRAKYRFKKGEAVCLFEWGASLPGLSAEGIKIKGVFPASGPVSLPYTLSVFTGTEYVPLNIYTDNAALDVIEPSAPSITDVKAIWGLKERAGFEQVTYNMDERLDSVTVVVEPRPYIQSVTFEDQQCFVYKNQEQCRFFNRLGQFGGEDALTGERVFALGANSDTDYFESLSQDLKVSWDYRAPEIAAFDYHLNSSGSESKNISVDGHDFVISKEEAILVIRTHHSLAQEDDLGELADPRIVFRNEEGHEHQPYLDVGDERLRFSIQGLYAGQNYYVETISKDKTDNLIIYRYDLTKVPDGFYVVEVNGLDKNGNGDKRIYEEQRFDRFAPEIKILFGGKEAGRLSELYFTDDLGAAAFSGWDDGSRISEFTLGGVDLPVTSDSPNVKFVSENIAEQLNFGETYTLTVKATDDAGNQSEKSIDIVYNPAQFSLDGVPNVIHQGVELGNFKVTQRDGRCTRAMSEEVASLITAVHRKACTIIWNEIPSGMEEVFYGVTSVVTGAPGVLGENRVSFDVMYHNTTGEKLRVASGEKVFNVVPASDIQLELDKKNLLAENVVGAEYGRSLLSRYMMTVSPGAVLLRSEFGNSGNSEERTYNQLYRSEDYTLNGVINDYAGIERPIFDRYQVTTKANYVLSPERSETKTFDVIRLPDERITANVDYYKETVLSTGDVTLNASVGRFDRSINGYIYDAATMGEWVVYPVVKTADETTPLAEPVNVDANGEASFDVSAQTLFDVSSKVYLVANIISPHPEYEREMTSRPTHVEVLKGTSVDGDIETRMLTGPIPLSTSVRFTYNSREDQLASTGIQWEVSDDGVTWTSVEDKRDSTLIYFTLREPTEKYVRVKTENASTGEISYSRTLKLVSYRQARLQVNAPRHIYPSQDVEFTLADYYEPLDDSWGESEWSFDGGETWVEGSTTQLHVFNEAGRHLVKARFKYIDAETVSDESAWSEAMFYANVVDPRPVVTRINTHLIAEAGVPMDVAAFAYNPHSGIELPIKHEWVLPNGETRNGEAFNFTFTSEELIDSDQLEFKVTSWVEGFKSQTQAVATKNVRGWGYDFEKLPISLALNTNILIAPSNIYATVSMPYIFAPGVEFTYEWIIDESVARIEYEKGRSALIIAEQSGMQEVKVIVRDNRGGVKELTKFIDVIEAEDMSGNIKLYGSNTYNRAPLMISATARANPGHPRDYANTYEWSVNGVVQPDFAQTIMRYEAKDAGVYTVSVKVTSNYGQVEEFTESIIVQPNEVPICAPLMRQTDTSVTLTPTCTDPDGRIIGYRWIWNGQEQGPYGSQIRFNKAQYPTLQVEFIAVDDSGGETRGNFEW